MTRVLGICVSTAVVPMEALMDVADVVGEEGEQKR
jgi:hypothetical protein